MKTHLIVFGLGVLVGIGICRAWFHPLITKGKEAFDKLEAELKAKYGKPPAASADPSHTD